MSGLIYYGIISGLLFGLYYSVMALGLNLVFGVLKIVNMAYGDFMAISAYFAFYLYTLYALPFTILSIIVISILIIIGIALYYTIIRKINKSEDPETVSFVIFFGFSLFIESLTFLEFGISYHTLPVTLLPIFNLYIFGIALPFSLIFIGIISLILIIFIFVYLNKNKYGLFTKAIMSNKDLSNAYGINISLIYALAIGIGFAITSIAGIFSPFIFGYIYPNEGVFITTITFSLVIIGGLGKPLGSIIGGLTYGFIESIVGIYYPSYIYLSLFIMLLIIIYIKPNGILGGKSREV
jgi:branched-chain amino acid transport system permease protein